MYDTSDNIDASVRAGHKNNTHPLEHKHSVCAWCRRNKHLSLFLQLTGTKTPVAKYMDVTLPDDRMDSRTLQTLDDEAFSFLLVDGKGEQRLCD